MMATAGTSGSLTFRKGKNLSMVEKLSKFSSIVKPDGRSIPGSPFRYNQKVSFTSNIQRKQIGDGRLNKIFKGKTATLKDDDVKNYISMYPVEGKQDTEEDDVSKEDLKPSDS